MPVSPSAPATHRALGCVQNYKQRGGSLTPVTKSRHFLGDADAPDDASHLLDEEPIVRESEMALVVRLQPKRLPDALHA
jgi:hypothetical protein